jgi:NAD(P)-dependent dehydrogenase (short-subunit alcohol dehydrogenase family)
VLQNALFSHLLTARHAAPLMIRKRRGLIVEVTEFDLLFSGGDMLAQLVKFARKGFAVMMAEELRQHGIAAVALTPGFLRSEAMLQHFGVTEANWREGGKKDPNFLESESPLFLGRAVAALARDRKVLERSGDLTSSWELAREYGFTDADGRRPDSGKHFTENVIPSLQWMQEGLWRHLAWLQRQTRRVEQYLGNSPAANEAGKKSSRKGKAVAR